MGGAADPVGAWSGAEESGIASTPGLPAGFVPPACGTCPVEGGSSCAKIGVGSSKQSASAQQDMVVVKMSLPATLRTFPAFVIPRLLNLEFPSLVLAFTERR